MKQLYFQNSGKWRAWLAENHNREKELWLIFYKKESQKPSPDYESAVEEALCFGWIDSIIKKIDSQRYARKFTPRKNDSYWSELNKKRVQKLISEGRMYKTGMAKVEYAKQHGIWDIAPEKPDLNFDLPAELITEFKKNKNAADFFKRLAVSYQKQFIIWINMAKRPETRQKRIKESVTLLSNQQKLGLK